MSKALAFTGCCYAVALWIASAFFGLSDDVLFFHTDLLSKSYFLAALAFLFLPLTLAVVGTAAGLFRKHALRVAGAFPLSLVLAGLLIFGGEWAFGKIQTFTAYLAFLGAAVAAAAALIWFLPNRGAALDRAGELSRLVLLVAVPFVAACWAYFHLDIRTARASAPRHVVMLLVDGMPSQLLSSYAPGTPPTRLDEVAARGCTMRNAYTSRTYTNGYFSVFYTGRYDRSAQDRASALPLLLEGENAGFRWMAFHANGFPESAKVTGYGGLRSALLSDGWVWLPRLLGLHHHVFLTWDNTRKYMGNRVNTLYEALNGRTDEDRIWYDLLPREAAAMQARFNRSFLLLHVAMGKNTIQAIEDGEFGDETPNIQSLFSYATKHGYTYTPEQLATVKAYRESYRTRIDQYGQRIGDFLDFLKKAGLAKDTLVVVTADHGSTFNDGRLWYGHHSDEEVARVPLFLFGEGIACESDLMIDTLDLRATIDGFLGLHETAPLGRNILQQARDSEAPKPIVVLNSPSDYLNQLNIQIRPSTDVRYLFNLHPKGDGKAVKGRIDGYAVHDVPLGDDDPAPWRMLAQALEQDGIKPESIHAGIRERMAKAARPR